MPAELFVYGTLHPERAPEEIAAAVGKLRPVGQGTIRGKLYDLGEFPAVVVNGGRGQKVSGSVFALPDDPETLASLDDYEEFSPSDPTNSLFVRSKRMVTLADGRRRLCWVYVYNKELPKAG
ncbi:gamma-glutamylcyclotransferase [Granulicella sp. WH15]|uniref:gamma-glutamylcyclotransferase family protein n=1 Tax=Granulicella sp. WH15 TaxID=2602070 RepID=UPI001367850A|nr:gamma-glutamylcyclotransferase family protein [Granulicella sp. WH15]QHN04918.1 gamma-glutamylcyclotransferase [Granulicella sp. WH15]